MLPILKHFKLYKIKCVVVKNVIPSYNYVNDNCLTFLVLEELCIPIKRYHRVTSDISMEITLMFASVFL